MLESIKFSLSGHYYARNAVQGVRQLLDDRLTKIALSILVIIVIMGVFGQLVAPYQYNQQQYSQTGELLRTEPPSINHPLGTTDLGYDVLSRILYGAQPTLLTGFLGGFFVITIGMTIGVVAGYVGGSVETILMRFTDFVYGVPLLPFAIVLLAFFGGGFWTTIFVIGLILWRGNARVIRSQVLQIKERQFIRAAKATGASTPHIIIKHILPNIASMVALFFAIGIGYTIIIQASLAFLGVANPFVPSWGVMLRNAYNSGEIASAWWWSFPPAILISLTVLSAFLLGRGYETSIEEKV